LFHCLFWDRIDKCYLVVSFLFTVIIFLCVVRLLLLSFTYTKLLIFPSYRSSRDPNNAQHTRPRADGRSRSEKKALKSPTPVPATERDREPAFRPRSQGPPRGTGRTRQQPNRAAIGTSAHSHSGHRSNPPGNAQARPPVPRSRVARNARAEFSSFPSDAAQRAGSRPSTVRQHHRPLPQGGNNETDTRCST
jgi:hypothetical protein